MRLSLSLSLSARVAIQHVCMVWMATHRQGRRRGQPQKIFVFPVAQRVGAVARFKLPAHVVARHGKTPTARKTYRQQQEQTWVKGRGKCFERRGLCSDRTEAGLRGSQGTYLISRTHLSTVLCANLGVSNYAHRNPEEAMELGALPSVHPILGSQQIRLPNLPRS